MKIIMLFIFVFSFSCANLSQKTDKKRALAQISANTPKNCLSAIAELDERNILTFDDLLKEIFADDDLSLAQSIFPKVSRDRLIDSDQHWNIKRTLSQYQGKIELLQEGIRKDLEEVSSPLELLKLEGDELRQAIDEFDFSDYGHFIINNYSFDKLNSIHTQLALGLKYDPGAGKKLRILALKKFFGLNPSEDISQLRARPIFISRSNNSLSLTYNDTMEVFWKFLQDRPNLDQLMEMDKSEINELYKVVSIFKRERNMGPAYKSQIAYLNENDSITFWELNYNDSENISTAYLRSQVKGLKEESRSPEKTFSISEEISDQVISASLITLKSLQDHEALAPKVLKLFMKILKTDNAKDLESSQSILKIEKIINEKLDSDQMKVVSGNLIQSIKKISRGEELSGAELARDGRRGWGYRWLRDNDKAFDDPKYLYRHSVESDALGEGTSRSHISFDNQDPKRVYMNEWNKLTHGESNPVVFTQTGSDANNFVYDLAFLHLQRSGTKNINDSGDIEVLFFEKTYGAGQGRMKNRHKLRYDGGVRHPYVLPSPTYRSWDPQDESVVNELIELENETLKLIREKVEKSASDKPIGALIMESITTDTSNAGYFRPEFPKRLKDLCDELGILLVSDEIMTMVRTGKTFAYEHYPGFKPDFVTFGKGAILAGVAQVEGSKFSYRNNPMYITYSVATELALKGAQVLKRVREDNLVEYAKKAEENYPEGFHLSGSKGLLIYYRNNRLLPYLDILPSELEYLLNSEY